MPYQARSGPRAPRSGSRRHRGPHARLAQSPERAEGAAATIFRPAEPAADWVFFIRRREIRARIFRLPAGD